MRKPVKNIISIFCLILICIGMAPLEGVSAAETVKVTHIYLTCNGEDKKDVTQYVAELESGIMDTAHFDVELETPASGLTYKIFQYDGSANKRYDIGSFSSPSFDVDTSLFRKDIPAYIAVFRGSTQLSTTLLTIRVNQGRVETFAPQQIESEFKDNLQVNMDELLPGMKFEMHPYLIPITAKAYTDGRVVIGMGLNASNVSFWTNAYKGTLSQTTDKQALSDAFWGNSEKKGAVTGGNMGLVAEFSGWVQGNIYSNEPMKGELSLYFGSGFYISGQYAILTWDVTVTAGAGAVLDFEFQYNEEKSTYDKFVVDSFAITFKAGLELYGGIGLSSIASIGVYGAGSITGRDQYYPDPVIQSLILAGECGFKVKAFSRTLFSFAIVSGSHEFVKDKLTGGRTNTALLNTANVDRIDSALLGAGYAGSTGAVSEPADGGTWYSGMTLKQSGDLQGYETDPDFDHKIAENIYPDNKLQVVNTGSQAIPQMNAVFLQSDGSRANGNRSRLANFYYSESDNFISEPSWLFYDDDGTADFNPHTFTSERGLKKWSGVVWQNALAPLSDESSFEDIAAGTDLYFSQFQVGSSWYSPERVTFFSDVKKEETTDTADDQTADAAADTLAADAGPEDTQTPAAVLLTDEMDTEEPAPEGPKTDEPVTGDPGTDGSVSEEPKTAEPVSEELTAEGSVSGEPETDDPVSEEPKTEEPVSDEPKSDKQAPEEQKTEDPVSEETRDEEPKPEETEPETEEPEADTAKAADQTDGSDGDAELKDEGPRVYATGARVSEDPAGEPVIVYYTSPVSDPAGIDTSVSHDIYVAHKEGTEWISEKVFSVTGSITNMEAAVFHDKQSIAVSYCTSEGTSKTYHLDLWETTGSSWQKAFSRTASGDKVVANGRFVKAGNGASVLTWYENKELYCMRHNSYNAEKLTNDDIQIPTSDYQIYGNFAKNHILIVGTGSKDSSENAFAIQSSNGGTTWGKVGLTDIGRNASVSEISIGYTNSDEPVVFYCVQNYDINSSLDMSYIDQESDLLMSAPLQGMFTGLDTGLMAGLMLGQNDPRFIDTTTDLYVKARKANQSVDITYARFDDETGAKKGNTTPVTVKVKNTGLYDISSVTLYEGENKLGDFSVDLKAGTETEIKTAVTVPADAPDKEMEFTLRASSREGKIESEYNVTLGVGTIDVKFLHELRYGNEALRYEVTNNGFPQKHVFIYLFDEETGENFYQYGLYVAPHATRGSQTSTVGGLWTQMGHNKIKAYLVTEDESKLAPQGTPLDKFEEILDLDSSRCIHLDGLKEIFLQDASKAFGSTSAAAPQETAPAQPSTPSQSGNGSTSKSEPETENSGKKEEKPAKTDTKVPETSPKEDTSKPEENAPGGDPPGGGNGSRRSYIIPVLTGAGLLFLGLAFFLFFLYKKREDDEEEEKTGTGDGSGTQ